MPDKRALVTDDRALKAGGKLTDADERILQTAETGEGGIELTPEKFRELAEQAMETMASFRAAAGEMPMAVARNVRRLRVDEGYSWRAVASVCHALYAGRWEPPTNQLMGMALCERAAQLHDEDYQQEPWNG